MPNRIIRQSINSSERVNSLSWEAEVFYRRLLLVVDDYGRYEASAKLLISACYPVAFDRVTVQDVEALVRECSLVRANDGKREQLLAVYEIEGRRYLQINNFGQRTRTPSKYPEPPSADICVQVAANARLARATNTPTHANTHTNGLDKKHFGDSEFEAWFERQYARHPKKKDRVLAEQAASGAYLSGDLIPEQFETKHKAWCESEEWRWKSGAKAPTLAAWITDLGYRYDPPIDGTRNGNEYAEGHMNPGLIDN